MLEYVNLFIWVFGIFLCWQHLLPKLEDGWLILGIIAMFSPINIMFGLIMWASKKGYLDMFK